MSLTEYRQKRDFAKTPEPQGAIEEEKQFFVIQEHDASTHHYDFRLALDGVLKSWAVPKGLPTELKVKRLAVQTEDHPLEYGRFEGEIPEGQYGAGKVSIFDRGRFDILEREDDKLVFTLEGQKIKGTFALVRFKGKEMDQANWLIMRVVK